MKKIVIGLTGASGSILAHKLVSALLALGHEVHFVSTKMGSQVMAYELDQPFEACLDAFRAFGDRFVHYGSEDLFSRIASGSFDTDAMVVVPCSMGTLAKISAGISDNLLCRAADVCLKETRPLILVTRETPLSSIHLENMLKLSRMGAVVMPPVPAYYHRPKTLEEVTQLSVGRILHLLKIPNSLHVSWQEGDFGE